jgi:hypothetical protein
MMNCSLTDLSLEQSTSIFFTDDTGFLTLFCFPCNVHPVTYFLYGYIQNGGEGRLRERYAKSIEPICNDDLR